MLVRKISSQLELYLKSINDRREKEILKVDYGLQVLMKYLNLKFQMKFDDGNDDGRKMVLSEDCLLNKIYSGAQALPFKDALEYISLLECHRMRKKWGQLKSSQKSNWQVVFSGK